jgi:signal transduction histidine kinase
VFKTISLRFRLAVSYLVLTSIICLAFLVVFIVAENYVEEELIYKRMAVELQRMIDAQSEALNTTPVKGMQFYVDEQFPITLAHLEPRQEVYEVFQNDKELAVLIKEVGGHQYAVTDDQTTFESVEMVITITLLLAFAVSFILALVFAKLSVGQVISPLTRLSTAVRSNTDDNIQPQHYVDEIGLLALAIKDRNKRLNELLLREKLFTSDVSHELRTPLAVILGAAEVLQVKLDNQQELLAFAERISRTAMDATERVSALLLLSRAPESIDAPHISLQVVLREEIDRHSILLENKPVQCVLTVDSDEWVFARSELVGIAVGNIIRNAFQYTEQGQVTVSLSATEIRIEDQGLGIPESLQDSLFNRFTRGDDNEQSGCGLGLSIVRRVCTHLGWALSYEPRKSGGCRFILAFAGNSSL